MPKVDDTPKGYRVYQAFGLYPSQELGSEGLYECPFCTKTKLYINRESGVYDCKTCPDSGNPLEFMRRLYQASTTRESEYEELAREKRILFSSTLQSWGLRKNLLSEEWLLPGYNASGDLVTCYRMVKVQGNKHFWNSPDLHHGLLGVFPLGEGETDTVYLCEGVWDGMVAWETLYHSSITNILVLAVPGCGVFFDRWCPLFEGKKVYLLYDNDHPRSTKQGVTVLPAGYQGMVRVAGLLASSSIPPESIHYLAWGSEGQDHNSELPNGYDLRDYLTSEV